jgi:molecular chaperone GrpE (heat shock protein)
MAHSPTLILDTHAAVHELVSAGMPERQAETVVRQQARLLEQNLATKTDLATIKADIEALRQETKADIEALRQETKALIETAKVDLIKWIFGLNIATMSLLVAAIKLL